MATTYYVSNLGNDLNSGLSLAQAFATLQHAADQVEPGDSVLVEDGTYAGFDLRTSGTEDQPIVFMALGNNALINQTGPIRDDGINIEGADYIMIDGFIVNDMPGSGNGIRVVLSDHCVVRNCRCDNNAERGIFTGFAEDILIEFNVCTHSVDEHGIYHSNSGDRPIIRFNQCYGNNNTGIHMNGDLSAGGDGLISDAQVYGNVLYDNNLAAGLNMDGVVNAKVYNNLIFDNHNAQGIALFMIDGAQASTGAEIYNNTIIVPDDGRWGILLADGAHVGAKIYNNIIVNQHTWRGCIATWGTNNLTCDYNLLNDKLSATGDGSTISLVEWQSLGLDLNSHIANPLDQIFVDPTNDDLHLSVNSQAIDKGTQAVSPVVSEDIDGLMRPQGALYDIGAYEFQSTTPAIDVHLQPDGILIYPNPTEDVFEIDGNLMGYTIQILNADLSVYQTLANIPPIEYDISSLPAGLYFISIRNDQNQLLCFRNIIKMD